MKPNHKKLSLLPLFLLSYTLACGGLQGFIVQQAPLEKIHSSQKQAVIDEISLFESVVMEPYIHPSKAFSYDAPENWVISNSKSSAIIHSPNTVTFSVSLIHTGYKLSNSSFVKLVLNTENIQYEGRDQYQMVYQEEDRENQIVFVEKTYVQDGLKKVASSFYRQIDQSIYIVEMVGDEIEIAAGPQYEALFLAFNDSIQDQQTSNIELPAYASLWQYLAIDNDYSLNVPLGWNLITDQSPELKHIQFNSPDGNAVVESFLYTPGGTRDLGFAVDYALRQLDSSYAKGSDDIRVTSEINLIHRKSEKITWVSRSGGYAGETYFEIRNRTQVFVLTRAWNKLFEDIYAPVLDTTFVSFESDSSLLR